MGLTGSEKTQRTCSFCYKWLKDTLEVHYKFVMFSFYFIAQPFLDKIAIASMGFGLKEVLVAYHFHLSV